MTETKAKRPEQYRIAIRRPVTMVMIFLTLIVFGIRSYQQLPVNLLPNISYPSLTVRTQYEGAAPEDIEKLVTRPLEELLGVVTGLVEISSVSSAGISDITLEFTWGTKMSEAQQEVRDRLDLFVAPREITEKPVILRYDPTLDPVIRFAIVPPETKAATPEERARVLTSVRTSAERQLKSDLEAQKGIAQAFIKGGQQEEIQVLVDAVRIKSLGLTVSDIGRSLAQQNINLSGGRLREGKTEYLVRTLNEYRSVTEIGDSLIPTANGQVRLRDVAEVYLGAKERETVVLVNGQEAVGVDIYKEGSANTVQVCNTVKDLLGIARPLTLMEQVARLSAEANQRQRAALGLPPLTSAETGKGSVLSHLPKGVQISLINDQSRFIRGAVGEVQDAAVIGGALSLAVLFLFLRAWRPTLTVFISIPISILVTFVPMFLQHITLNIMSLGGLALGIGMMVDDAVVVMESIFRCKEEGDSDLDAAERGTQEVHDAVISTTVTTVCVFLPLAFVEGVAGQMFNDMALAVTYSLMISLAVSLYLVPLISAQKAPELAGHGEAFWLTRAYGEARAHGGRLRAIVRIPGIALRYVCAYLAETAQDDFVPAANAITGMGGGLRAFLLGLVSLVGLPFLLILFFFQLMLKLTAVCWVTPSYFVLVMLAVILRVVFLAIKVVFWVPLELFERFFDALRAFYGWFLRRALRFSAVVLVLTVVLAAHSTWLMTKLGSTLMPEMKQGEFTVRLETRAGTSVEQTAERAARVSELLRGTPEVETFSVEAGKEKSDASLDRGENIALFSVIMRDPEHAARFQDQVVSRLREQIVPGPGEKVTFSAPSMFTLKTAVELQIFGDELSELKHLGQQAMERLTSVPGLTDLELSARPGYPEVIIELDRKLLASKNISPETVANTLRGEVQGDVATKFSRAGEKVDIRVRTDRAMLRSVDDLRQLAITNGRVTVPLSDIAQIRQQEGPSEIRRTDQQQVVLIRGNVHGRDLAAVSRDMLAVTSGIEHAPGYYFMPGGQYRELDSSYRSLNFAFWLAVFLVYVVMACQFESLWHPFLIMFTVPLGVIGVAYALIYTRTDLSIMVFLGGIILVGIVVDNAIILIDYVNQLRARGLSKIDALVLGGQVRLRPILMTAITSMLGLIPMVFLKGEGTEMERPMAITVMAGLSSATILTLVIMPMVYYLFTARDSAPAPESAPPEAAP